ncbi:MAG: hypothetical protein R3F20_18740 [Planctomycetota bacterium]
MNYNPAGGHDALSVGAITCNSGPGAANWNGATADHPVFVQQLYRLSQGRFEMVGLSWARHATIAAPATDCGACTASPGVSLPANCSDPLSAGLMASQTRLGPRSEIDPQTGQFPFPATDLSTTGDATFKRLRVPLAELDPALHPGARWFVETRVVSASDAGVDAPLQNTSWRELTVTGGPNNFLFALTPGESTQVGEPALFAWRDIDASVQVTEVLVPGDGRFLVAFRSEPLPGGSFRYEFALSNVDSNRAARGFRVTLPVGAAVSDFRFHGVSHHSGESFSDAPWTPLATATEMGWATDDFALDPDANALRWGTQYNFGFTSDLPPDTQAIDVALDLFAPGTPTEVTVAVPPVTFLSVVQGDDQSGNFGEDFGVPLEIFAVDSFGNPVAGAPIVFTMASGSGALDFPNGNAATTDATGHASVVVGGGTTTGQVTVAAGSVVSLQSVTFDLFTRRMSRNWFAGPGVLVLGVTHDWVSQPMTLAIDASPPAPQVTPWGTICTSVLAPGPGFYAETGYQGTPFFYVPSIQTSTVGTLTKPYTGLAALSGSGITLVHQAYAYRFVGGNLEVWVSNCITATY